MDNLDFLNIVFLENEVKDYLIFVLILLFGYLLISPISSYLRKIIFRIVGNKNHVDGKAEFDNLLKKPLYYFLLLLIFYFAFNNVQNHSFRQRVLPFESSLPRDLTFSVALKYGIIYIIRSNDG